MRIASACRMLRKTALPVTDIAFENGFETIPHFSRLFRRLVGRSPSAFRNDSSK
jgi:AraC-like DNA-binding protein